jgi:hypothetical protein
MRPTSLEAGEDGVTQIVEYTQQRQDDLDRDVEHLSRILKRKSSATPSRRQFI